MTAPGLLWLQLYLPVAPAGRLFPARLQSRKSLWTVRDRIVPMPSSPAPTCAYTSPSLRWNSVVGRVFFHAGVQQVHCCSRLVRSAVNWRYIVKQYLQKVAAPRPFCNLRGQFMLVMLGKARGPSPGTVRRSVAHCGCCP
jgi:hypothetical protein